MLRMVFEIVMVLAVICCLVFLTKISSLDNRADDKEDKPGDNAE